MNTIPMRQCMVRLTVLWFGAAGLIMLAAILMSIFKEFGDQSNRVWSWLLPTIMPTLSLIAASLAVTAKEHKNQQQPQVDLFFYRLVLVLSSAYLLLVALTILLVPISVLTTSGPNTPNATSSSDLLTLSNLWLGPIQGLTTATLGVFFMRKKNEKEEL